VKHYGHATNLLTAATIVALNPVASEALYRTQMVRAGGGLVRLTGAYTGAQDAEFEVEVVNNTIVGTPRVSAPTFNGVGNAAMTAVTAAGGTAAQSITVTLADLGTETRSAYTPFQGSTLRAKAAGADANYIQITVSEAGIVRTPTDAALLADLVAGTNGYRGDEWDFGALPRNPDGTLPPGCPRLSFGDDPQVYRAFKVFSGGEYFYSFAPPPVRSVPKDSIVKAVTGSRTVTVTHTLGAAAVAFAPAGVYTLGQLVRPTTPNGHWYECTGAGTADTEPTWSTTGGSVTTGGATFIDRGQHTRSYASIITLYDALSAIQGDAASLIEVVEPIVNDLGVDGMGATELSVRTSAYVQNIIRDGTINVRTAALSVTVDAGAPTEEVTIRCISAGTPNGEVFDVRGTVSGQMPPLVTGVAYHSGYLDLLVPLLPVPTSAPATSWSTKLESTASPKPVPCVKAFHLGALAQPRTFTFEYQLRTTGCDCDGATVVGGPNPIFLGVDPETNVESLPPELKARAEDLAEWRADFIEAKTDVTPSVSADDSLPIEASTLDGPVDFSELRRRYSAVITADRIDIAAANKVYDLFYSTLRAVYDHEPGDTPTAAGTLWDEFFTAMQVTFDSLAANNFGSDFWQSAASYIALVGTGGSTANTLEINKKVFTDSFDMLIERYKAQMARVYIAADIEPPFDGPAGTGSGPWVDYGEKGWLVATDSNLLSPVTASRSRSARPAPRSPAIRWATTSACRLLPAGRCSSAADRLATTRRRGLWSARSTARSMTMRC
jgi:hypothetical protein